MVLEQIYAYTCSCFFTLQVHKHRGTGDAHLAGLIVGLTIGLSMEEAQQLATLTGGSSVESPHTINHETDRKSLRILADRSRSAVNKNVYKFLEDKDEHYDAYYAAIRCHSRK